MNREDIVRMAQEAQMPFYWRTGEITYLDKLEAFAALVASAAVRETSAEYRLGWNDGQIAEREAIAQMIEDAPTLMDFAQNDQGDCLMCGFTPKLAAETIRARGQA